MTGGSEGCAGTFGELLRGLRGARGLTQEDLADRAGLHAQEISKLERGVRRSPRSTTVAFLAEALRLDAQERRALEAAARGSPAEAAGRAAAAMRTLPRDVPSFTGRHDELARLLAMVTDIERGGGAVVISAIDGMAGVGKTALAVHVAHRLAPAFPDGQLFLSMHAHTAGVAPITPADALGTLLLTTGVGPRTLPAGLDARAAMWRDRLAGLRMLIVLDDAAGHEQVRPLLPGSAGCLVLITSRRRLAALEHVESLTLGTLPADQARELFVRLGGERARRAGAAVTSEVADLCGHLPLAIGLVAGRLRSHPSWSARNVAEILRDAQDRLAELRVDDVAVEAAFRLSYQDLAPAQRRLFRRLGLHPGRDIDARAAAALEGGRPAEARRRLDALFNAHMVDEPLPGRYRLHDLIRAYARRLAAVEDPGDIATAVDRLLDYYVRGATTANRSMARRCELEPEPPLGTLPHGPNGIDLPDLSTRAGAMAWFETERENLGDCVEHAAAHGRPAQAAFLSHALHSFLRIAGHWDHALAVHDTARRAAALAGDRPHEAVALNDLGLMQCQSDAYRSAATSLERSLALHRETGSVIGQANALNDLGILRHLTGDYPGSAAALTESLALYRTLADRCGQANALINLADAQRLMSQYAAAMDSLTAGLELAREIDDRFAQARALFRIGDVQNLICDWHRATASLSSARALFRQHGDRYGEANALNVLGIAWRELGQYRVASSCLARALALYRELGSRVGQANVLQNLASVRRESGDHRGAAAILDEALVTYRELRSHLGQANVLRNLGTVRLRMGDHAGATSSLTEALQLYRAIQQRHGEAEALTALGAVLLDSSRRDDAVVRYREALAVARDVGVPLEEARALEGIGLCLTQEAAAPESAAHLRASLAIYERLGSREADRVRASLRSLDGSSAPRLSEIPPRAVTEPS